MLIVGIAQRHIPKVGEAVKFPKMWNRPKLAVDQVKLAPRCWMSTPELPVP